ncbi:MAG TPA: GGDEF domain-containing protein [Anaerolineales bacterium]|nr:GGDEF domain-containing protein [Anaerolineales bacterium]
MNRFRVDLGEMEGDYRLFYLKDDSTQSILYICITIIGVLSMIRMDALFFKDQPDLFKWLMLFRGAFILISILVITVLWKTSQANVYDRLTVGWLSFTVLFLLLFNFTRPPNFTTTIFDVIVIFAIYMFTPPEILYSLLLALSFSAGTIYIDQVYKAGIVTLPIATVIIAQLLAHALGFVAGLKIQSYRRKSFKAYMQEKDARELAAYLANIDPLTKSLTRRHFFSMAGTEFSRSLRYHRPLSMLVLDADLFKNINDTYGHHTGDQVLRNLSLVILEQKRAQDVFGRLGGEEFALLLPETSVAQAKIVAERIQKTWEQTPSIVEGNLIRSTVSIGVAEMGTSDTSIEDVLRRADRMMYKAKEAGRNTVVAE